MTLTLSLEQVPFAQTPRRLLRAVTCYIFPAFPYFFFSGEAPRCVALSHITRVVLAQVRLQKHALEAPENLMFLFYVF